MQKPNKKQATPLQSPRFQLHLQNAQANLAVPKRAFFQRCIRYSLKYSLATTKLPELTIRIVDEPEMLALNQTFRGKSYPTNVLAFPFSPESDSNSELLAISALFDNGYLGDIALCASIIAKEASEQDKDLQAHWAHLVVHGVLHLLGYDHMKPEQTQVMETAEIAILQRLGYPNPYQ